MKSFAILALGALFSAVIANPLLTGPICDIVCPEDEGLAICAASADSTESTCSCCPIGIVSPVSLIPEPTATEPPITCDLACALPLVLCPPCSCCEPSNGTVTLPIPTPTGIICDIACPLDGEEICEPCSCCGSGPIVATLLAD